MCPRHRRHTGHTKENKSINCNVNMIIRHRTLHPYSTVLYSKRRLDPVRVQNGCVIVSKGLQLQMVTGYHRSLYVDPGTRYKVQ